MPTANRVSLDIKSPGVDFNMGRKRQGAHNTWFRGDHCNFNPARLDTVSSTFVHEHILSGWLPEKAYITPDTNIVAFGSCFAANITKWLEAREFKVASEKDGEVADTYLVRFGEGLVTTFAIRQQFEWALRGKTFLNELWHDKDGNAHLQDARLQGKTRSLIMKGDVFIITLGLSEIWYDEPTGEAFWRAVPADKHDPARHKFRVSTVSENKENLVEIVKLIRGVRPEAKVIFTVSPIPLVATFRSNSCITSNAASKAILRAALDEMLREAEDSRLYYWPSYEIVMNAFQQPWCEDRRHVIPEVLDFVMTQFESVWCEGSKPRMTIAEAWLKAGAVAGMCPKWLPKDVETEELTRIERYSTLDLKQGGLGIMLAIGRMKEIAQSNPGGPIERWLAAPAPRLRRLLNPVKPSQIKVAEVDQR